MSSPNVQQQKGLPLEGPSPVTHVVFDVDGLLVDSEHYYYEAIKNISEKFGKEFTFQIKCEMMGTKPIEGAIIAIDRMGLTGKVTPEEFVKLYETEMAKNCHKIKLMPGAERLIHHLREHKIPIAIATGATDVAFNRKTGHLGEIIRKPFSHHVFAGSDPDVKRGKPHPDVFIVAAERFNPPPKSPKQVLVFEDAVNGVNAALKAGMQVVFVPDKWVDLSKVDVKPTQTIKSLYEFNPEQYGLPPWDHPETLPQNQPKK